MAYVISISVVLAVVVGGLFLRQVHIARKQRELELRLTTTEALVRKQIELSQGYEKYAEMLSDAVHGEPERPPAPVIDLFKRAPLVIAGTAGAAIAWTKDRTPDWIREHPTAVLAAFAGAGAIALGIAASGPLHEPGQPIAAPPPPITSLPPPGTPDDTPDVQPDGQTGPPPTTTPAPRVTTPASPPVAEQVATQQDTPARQAPRQDDDVGPQPAPPPDDPTETPPPPADCAEILPAPQVDVDGCAAEVGAAVPALR